MARFRSNTDLQDHVTSYQDALLWPDTRTGPWLVVVTWAGIAGRDEPVGLEIRSCREREAGKDWPAVLPTWDQSPAILATTTLRKLPIATIVAELRREREAAHEEFTDWLAAQPEFQSEADQADLRRLRTAGRRRPSAQLAEVARVYQHAWETGQAPTRAVAGHFTISQSAAAKRVSRARQAGYLPTTSKGKPRAQRQQGAGTGKGEETR